MEACILWKFSLYSHFTAACIVTNSRYDFKTHLFGNLVCTLWKLSLYNNFLAACIVTYPSYDFKTRLFESLVSILWELSLYSHLTVVRIVIYPYPVYAFNLTRCCYLPLSSIVIYAGCEFNRRLSGNLFCIII